MKQKSKNKNNQERVLTAKEKERQERMDALTSDMESKGYRRKDHIISLTKANIFAVLIAVPFFVIFNVWFIKVSGSEKLIKAFNFLTDENVSLLKFYGYFLLFILLFVVVFSLLCVVHELLHGLTWGIFAKDKFKSIEFGFIKEHLTPYCTCSQPIKKWQYILGGAVPGVILGILPSIVAVYCGSVFLLLMGICMISGAGGDLMIIIKMLRYKTEAKEVVIIDHPTEGGFITFER